MRALSIRQPWAWLIVNGHKDIENRDWSTSYRGPLLIHASLTLTRKYHLEIAAHIRDEFGIELPPYEVLERGGVVGITNIVDCVSESDSRWFTGAHGFVLQDSRPLPFHPCKGALSYFDVPGHMVGIERAVV